MILRTKALAGSLALSLVVTACIAGAGFDDEAMLIKASQLTKLSTVVESTVRYKNPPADLDEQSLLKLSTQHDPQLLENFSGFKVRVLSKERHGVVLICTEDGQRGLLEDAACTLALDRHHWKDSQNQPCEFTVATETSCPAP
jgi:hypothetical protein